MTRPAVGCILVLFFLMAFVIVMQIRSINDLAESNERLRIIKDAQAELIDSLAARLDKAVNK